MLLQNDRNELALSPTLLIHLLTTLLTSRDTVPLLMVSTALRNFILSDEALRERYWKTKTRHYFYNINTQHFHMPNLRWKDQFTELQKKHEEGITERLASLFLAARSNNLSKLQELNLRFSELYERDGGNTNLYDVISKSRHQGIKDYVFETIILPSYTKNKEIIFFRVHPETDYTLFHHAALLNQAITSTPEKKAQAQEALNTYADRTKANQLNFAVSPLHLAAQRGNVTAIKTCVEEYGINPDLHEHQNQKYTPLHEASVANNCASISTLLDLGADIEATATYQDDSVRYPITPLACAALCGHFKAFHLLIQRGANPLQLPQPLLLHFAILGGDIKIFNAVIELGEIDLNAGYDPKLPPLHLAVRKGDYYITKRLLTLGAKPKKTTLAEDRLFHSAVISNSLFIVEFVLEHISEPGDINAKNKADETPLHFAIRYKVNTEIVSALLKKGADVNAINNLNETPLHYAMQYDADADVVSILLKKGADVNAKNLEGKTPLHYAAKSQTQNATLMKMLLDHGAAVNPLDKKGHTPLEFLLRRKNTPNHTEQLKLLIQKRAALNKKNKFIKILNFSNFEIPLSILLAILNNTPNLTSLSLENSVITVNPDTENDLSLEARSLRSLRNINITGMGLPSIPSVKIILSAASPECSININDYYFRPKSTDPKVYSNTAELLISRSVHTIYAMFIMPTKEKKLEAPMHTTLFSQPGKRSSESEDSASKRLKI